ncbi:SsgA family sporulation/cell division regulator (plasmid) [Streptomyces sp. NBC_01369]|uniref:SsgA family sporulation/cell division regulator n=1 Tax=Streptomyces sp. NBC_01369 TaxID=2903842 RepID=UPI002F908BC7
MSLNQYPVMDDAEMTEDEFDALLEASSLGAQHVLAETEPIPAEVESRMTQALAGEPRHQDHEPRSTPTLIWSRTGRPITVLCADPRAFAVLRSSARLPSSGGVVVGHLNSGKTHVMAVLAILAARRQTPHHFDRRMRDLRQQPFTVIRTERLIDEAKLAFSTPCVHDSERAPALPAHAPYGCAHPAAPPPALEQTRHVHAARMTDLLMAPPTAVGIGETCPSLASVTAWDAAGTVPPESRPNLLVPRRRTAADEADLWSFARLDGDCESDFWHATFLTGQHRYQPIAAIREHRADLAWPQQLLLASHLPTLSAPPRRLASHGAVSHEPHSVATAREAPVTCTGEYLHRGDQEDAGELLLTEQEGTPVLRGCVEMLFHEQENDPGAPVAVELAYRPSDPFAVQMTFHPGTDESVVWLIARGLLIDGLSRSAGDGDVVIWTPEPTSPHEHQRTYLRLNSPHGKALLSISHQRLRHYLERTRQLCTVGAEDHQVAAALDALESDLSELACRGRTDWNK